MTEWFDQHLLGGYQQRRKHIWWSSMGVFLQCGMSMKFHDFTIQMRWEFLSSSYETIMGGTSWSGALLILFQCNSCSAIFGIDVGVYPCTFILYNTSICRMAMCAYKCGFQASVPLLSCCHLEPLRLMGYMVMLWVKTWYLRCLKIAGSG